MVHSYPEEFSLDIGTSKSLSLIVISQLFFHHGECTAISKLLRGFKVLTICAFEQFSPVPVGVCMLDSRGISGLAM